MNVSVIERSLGAGELHEAARMTAKRAAIAATMDRVRRRCMGIACLVDRFGG
jgi:hypothetical protein